MSQKPVTQRAAAEKVVKEIRRATRKQHSAEEKIRTVLAGLRGEDSIGELCRREDEIMWAGYGGTFFWIGPAEDLVAVLMTQMPGATRAC